MKYLIFGASGATGSLVALELMRRSCLIRVFVREKAVLPSELINNQYVEIERGSITEQSDMELAKLIEGCTGIVCCLGHNITFKGMFGHPGNLVSDSLKNICRVINTNSGPQIKIILMSTTAYTNAKNAEKNSFGEKMVFSIIKLLLPPHRDNVNAADFLQNSIGTENSRIDWIAVRPDTLINEVDAGLYEVYRAPVRSPVFNAGKVSRINVSRFIADLLTDDQLWNKWHFQMPVIYNTTIE